MCLHYFPSSQATGGFHMRKCIGSALLLVMLAAYPALGAAQRRGAARPAARSADRPSFGLELNWSSDVDFGIGGAGGAPPRLPRRGAAARRRPFCLLPRLL